MITQEIETATPHIQYLVPIILILKSLFFDILLANEIHFVNIFIFYYRLYYISLHNIIIIIIMVIKII